MALLLCEQRYKLCLNKDTRCLGRSGGRLGFPLLRGFQKNKRPQTNLPSEPNPHWEWVSFRDGQNNRPIFECDCPEFCEIAIISFSFELGHTRNPAARSSNGWWLSGCGLAFR